MLLIGDIGGTKTQIAIGYFQEQQFQWVREERFLNDNFSSFEEVFETFWQPGKEPITACVFGVAGPVLGEEVKLPNLDWILRLSSVESLFKTKKVAFVNDLEAYAQGISELKPDDFETLNEGKGTNPKETQAIIAAGTGLGHAILAPFSQGQKILPSEGGHISFAPRNPEEIRLLEYLLDQFERVSIERVVSGPGLFHLFKFYQSLQQSEISGMLKKKLATGDPSEVVANMALNEKDEVCVQALNCFVRLYGAQAGDFALSTLATGGIFLGGGIPMKILPFLRSEAFQDGFQSKGRLSELVKEITVKVILNPKTPLLGAAKMAQELAEKG